MDCTFECQFVGKKTLAKSASAKIPKLNKLIAKDDFSRHK